MATIVATVLSCCRRCKHVTHPIQEVQKSGRNSGVTPSESGETGFAMRRGRSVALLGIDGVNFLHFISSHDYDAHSQPSDVTHIILVADHIRNLAVVVVPQI